METRKAFRKGRKQSVRDSRVKARQTRDNGEANGSGRVLAKR